jgi:parallel beta-helix repeat protein
MKRTALVLTIILSLIISTVAGTHFVKPVMARTITVPKDYPTIQAAIGNATDGDTIFVNKGTYNESVTVDKTLTLTGEDRQETIIIGTHAQISQLSVIDVVGAVNVTISGFTLKDSDVGVLIEGSNGQVSSGCKIIGNNIVNNGEGIVSRGVNISIAGNSIVGNSEYGIYVSSSDTAISGNKMTGNGYSGIIADDSTNVTISGNTVTGNGVNENGARELRGGLNLRWFGPFYVHGNTIADNQGWGIQLGESCNNATIYDNSIERNRIGVNLFNFVFEGDAPVGLGNIVYQNNLVDNSQQAFVEKTYGYYGNTEPYTLVNGTDIVSWDNGTVGNYWSDFTTKYPNASEVGTTGLWNMSYVIDENNTDHYPLMQPVEISPASPLTTVVVVVAVVILVVVVAGVLVYFKKRKH